MTLVQLRRGTAGAWTAQNVTLADGEPGFEHDTGLIKIGDGVTAWTSLPYVGGGGGGGIVGGTITLTNPGAQAAVQGTPITPLVLSATCTDGGTITYTSTTLPAGLTLNATTGHITGTPSASATTSVTVTAHDSLGSTDVKTFSWVVSASVGSAYDTAVLANGPVAYWPLDDATGTTARDATAGHTHPGTYSGAVTLGSAGPCSDGSTAIVLGGAGYVTIPDSAALRLINDVTVEAWYCPPAGTVPGNILLVTKDSGYSAGVFHFLIYATYEPKMVRTLVTGGLETAGAAAVSMSLVASTWTHLAVTVAHTSGDVIFYQDGAAVLTVSGALVGPAVDNSQPVHLGADGYGTTELVGKLAKVAVYGSVLTAGQIAAHYAAR